MSIQKIARLAGVSVATVSRVLNNSDTVKAKNRERVLQAIKESNYQPNLLARQLRTARSKMILVMVSNIANPFCAEVVKGIEEEAEKNGYRILLCNSGSDLARSTSGLQLLSGKMVDGIITMNALSSLPELTTMIGDAPWVQCAEYADTGSISCVGINDVEAAQGRYPGWPIAAAAASRSLITTSAIAMPVCASAAIKACCTCTVWRISR